MMSSEYDEREQAELKEEISASIDTGGEEVEEWPDFPIDSFQVVRNQFFAHTREPSVSLKGGKMSVNTACLNKMPGVDYIQVLINQITKTLVLRPCQESDIYSIQWCTYRAKDRKRNRLCVKCWGVKRKITKFSYENARSFDIQRKPF